MTYEEAKSDIIDIDTFCSVVCDCCISNDAYCPKECSCLRKARKLDFSRIVKCYARHDGDLSKVVRYITATKINRIKGGY